MSSTTAMPTPVAKSIAAPTPKPLAPIHNAKTITGWEQERIFVAARTGRGKTAQGLTLPGKKFCYVFDQNALPTLRGHDIDYITFLPDHDELEMRLRGFNKDSAGGHKSDRGTKQPSPQLYLSWVEDFNARHDAGFFAAYDWCIFDSLTLLVESMFERQLFLDGKAGEPPAEGDYRVVGLAVARIVASLSNMGCNVYMTGHINEYENDLTKRVTTQLYLPGSARMRVPFSFTQCWQLDQLESKREFRLRTIPDPRGLQDIRTSIPGLKEWEDVTIADFRHPEQYGIGKILRKAGFKTKAETQPKPDSTLL